MPDKTSMFDRAIPVLASLEIATSLDFFHKLGFETHDFGDHNYGIAIREHIEIHFWLCADKHVAENTSCYVRVNDIHALHADLAKRFDVGEIVETPWGMDELYVIDPSGGLVKFGQVTDRFIQAGRRARSAFGLIGSAQSEPIPTCHGSSAPGGMMRSPDTCRPSDYRLFAPTHHVDRCVIPKDQPVRST